MMNAAMSVFLLVLLWTAAAADLRRRRIPNRLTLGGAFVGVMLQAASAGTGGITVAAAGFVVGALILMPGFLLRATGPGDVKLLAAVGTVMGPYHILIAGLASIVVGAVIAVGIATAALAVRAGGSPWRRYAVMLRTLSVTGRPLYIPPAADEVMATRFPFAVAIALGATLAAAWSGLLGGIGVQP